MPVMPRVYLNYSLHSAAHIKAVTKLVNRLRKENIDVHFAENNKTPDNGWFQWMKDQTTVADFILVVCSINYKRILEQRRDDFVANPQLRRPSTHPINLKGDWTDTITEDIFYENAFRSPKIIPVLFDDSDFVDCMPLNLENITHYRVPSDFDILCRRLKGQNNPFQRINVKTVTELFDAISPMQERWRNGRWFFRGISNASWHLMPSLFRISFEFSKPTSIYHNIYVKWLMKQGSLDKPFEKRELREALAYRAVEWVMLLHFVRSANLKGFHVPDLDHWWTMTREDSELTEALTKWGQWPINRIIHPLAFAQHHLVPTRLLDWSFSPYSACWFAASNTVESLFNHQFEQASLFYETPDDACFCIWAINAESEKLSSNDRASLDFIEPGYHFNPRINAQKGVFTLICANSPGTPSSVEMLGHDQFIKNNVKADHPLLVQIVAPHQIAPAVLKALARHGVTRSTIYPSVDYVYEAHKDMFRAETIKDMKWLSEPTKWYLPKGTRCIPICLNENMFDLVKEWISPEEGNISAVVNRLFKMGLESEIQARRAGASDTKMGTVKPVIKTNDKKVIKKNEKVNSKKAIRKSISSDAKKKTKKVTKKPMKIGQKR